MATRSVFGRSGWVLRAFAAIALLSGCDDSATTSQGGGGAGSQTTGTLSTTSGMMTSTSTGTQTNCVDPVKDCPASGTMCATPKCNADGTCGTTNAAKDSSCKDSDGIVCDGKGACVECTNVDFHCPPSTNECEIPACTAGKCVTTPVSESTPTSAGQTAGDCKLIVCDGAGGTKPVDDDDPLDDGNDCTLDTCVAGVNTPVTVMPGTACATNGGKVCGSGSKAATCVECISNASCTNGEVCDTSNDNFVCVSPSCMDGMKDGSETGVDCGGTCGACGNGQTCGVAGDCVSGFCSSGVCAACGSDANCPASSFCDSATSKCTPDKADGATCGGASQCTSGSCADGVCCDTACAGTCSACSAAKKGQGLDGVCEPLGTGSDPDNECATTASTTCGTTGTCDGAGACAFYPASTQCAPSSCVGSTFSPADSCNGMGACVDSGSMSCNGYICNGVTGTCLSSCLGDADCAAGNFCTFTSQCIPKQADGASCSLAKQCVSNNCVDGVCCGCASCGTCQACNVAGSLGACANVPSGQADVGTCSGQNVCDGAGGCVKADGAGCAANGECLNNHCVDGTCCNSTCNSLCQACSAAKKGTGTDGVCGNIANNGDPDGECIGAFACNGSGGCQSCADNAKDGSETDIDCGSPSCPKCALGKMCMSNTDCLSNVCVASVCTNATCTDAIKNGTETDVDCGGASCPKCANTKMCLAGTDCINGVCTAGICQAPSCSDGVKNGTETDIDCGSTCMNKCMNGKMCAIATDCLSGVCNGGICQTPNCSDLVKNGTETDVDCGGASCTKCANTKMCMVNADCVSGLCSGGVCTPVSVCGNGVITSGEQCDDNNVANGDGCSSGCTCETSRSVQSGPGLNLAIPDDGYNGTLASMACVSLPVSAVTGCNQTISNLTVLLGMNHTWVGDLTIKLRSPAGTVVTLMSLPGFVEFADDGVDDGNNSGNLVNGFPITFATGAATSAENMGAGGSAVNVCQNDGLCSYNPNPGAAAPGTLASFNGQTAAGTWQLCVGDSATFDTGSIDQVRLNFTY
ncbi:MAG: proprotein convertase P-domain-containing protein [Polyangiaceae bacterium]